MPGGVRGPWLAAAVVILAAGCSQPSRVTGTVTFDGKPLPAGKVVFLCDGGIKPAISATIKEDGGYEIVNPPVGLARVTVQTFEPVAAKPLPGIDPMTGREYAEDWVESGPYVRIPGRYAVPKTSGLECTIVPGGQTFDIELVK